MEKVKKKTHRAAAKRFKETGSGEYKRFKAYKSHILAKKSAKRKRNLRKAALASAGDKANLRRMI